MSKHEAARSVVNAGCAAFPEKQIQFLGKNASDAVLLLLESS